MLFKYNLNCAIIIVISLIIICLFLVVYFGLILKVDPDSSL